MLLAWWRRLLWREAHAAQLAVNTTVTGSLVLNGGAVLTMQGKLTLADGSIIVLRGGCQKGAAMGADWKLAERHSVGASYTF